jgi:hypothetical protein
VNARAPAAVSIMVVEDDDTTRHEVARYLGLQG